VQHASSIHISFCSSRSMQELALASDMLPVHLHTGPAGEPEVNGSLDAGDADGEEPQLQRKQPKKKKQSKRSVSFDMDNADEVSSGRQPSCCTLKQSSHACLPVVVHCMHTCDHLIRSHVAQVLLAFFVRSQQ
jgi:hypothetical protein